MLWEVELCQLSVLSGCSSEQDPDGQERGLLFSGSYCDSAFAGDGAVFALGTSSTYRTFQTAHSPWHNALVWYLPGCDTVAHVPARPPAPSHPRNKHSSELSSLSGELLPLSGRGLVRNQPRKQSKAGQSKLHQELRLEVLVMLL